jgi:signal transduction histidine kinase
MSSHPGPTIDRASEPAVAQPSRAPLAARLRRGLTAYARWLDGITWKRFFLLALLALIGAQLLGELPPFNVPWGADRKVVVAREKSEKKADPAPRGNQPPPDADAGGASPAPPPAVVIEPKPKPGEPAYRISIGSDGVRVEPVASGASAPGPGAAKPKVHIAVDDTVLGAEEREEIRRALEEAGEDLGDALDRNGTKVVTVRAFRPGDHFSHAMVVLIVLSAVLKIASAGRFRAEAQAAAATERAGEEALKRQVVEARMAAMQAQVEPHFLFNTLASIDHLIETDPPRASRMQKHLIALLRASMPSLRESAAEGSSGVRELARELDVIRPYLEILKVRMEERLQTTLDIPSGLHSALFPPMMIQSLVENAIKHGLEPKPEGGSIAVRAEVIDGRLSISVADTGLGFGKAATAGTGVGLENIRERLALLYGAQASLAVRENPGGGTIVTVTVPYAVKPAAARTEPAGTWA